MRVRSAGAVKQIPQSLATQAAPKPGTHMRSVYDLLRSNPGRSVTCLLKGTVQPLTDFYGLDIRRNADGSVTLLGEYVGEFYHDHIGDRIVHQRDL